MNLNPGIEKLCLWQAKDPLNRAWCLYQEDSGPSLIISITLEGRHNRRAIPLSELALARINIFLLAVDKLIFELEQRCQSLR